MIKIYSIIFIKSCKLRTVRSLPGKGNLILRGVFPSSVEIIVIRRHSVDRTRWLAAYYRANQQSRWRWRHAGLLDADWWGVERLSFYIVSQSLAGSVGIRKRTRHYLEYIVTRRYIVELVRDSAKRQRWPFVRVTFYRTIVVLKPKRDIGERKKVRSASSRVYLAQVQYILWKFNFLDIELSRKGLTSFSFFVCGETLKTKHAHRWRNVYPAQAFTTILSKITITPCFPCIRRLLTYQIRGNQAN